MRILGVGAVLSSGMVGLLAALVTGCFNSREDCDLNPILQCGKWGSGGGSSSGSMTTTSAGGNGGGGGGAPPGSCVPSESMDPVADDCGVFVSSSLGVPGSDGTKEAPFKTIQEALDKKPGKDVYACAEELGGSVVLSSGVTIYGGLDCGKGKGWAYVGGETKSMLVGEVDKPALMINKEASGAVVVDFSVKAADAAKEGGSSIAVLVDGATVELSRCDLVAGAGAKGKDGEPGDPNGQAASAGGPGNPGANACMGDVVNGNPGGAGVPNMCGGMDPVSVGGAGGKGEVANGVAGSAGQTGAFGAFGTGEPAMGMWSCGGNEPNGLGDAGEDGQPGNPGPGAMGLGTVSSQGYTGTNGMPGMPGTPGQGGGGGGGAKGGAAICAGMTGAGASGGSGGAGGCGGKPGQGGQAGGASLALLSFQATMKLTDCTLTAGKGGDGGKGGDLQPGGIGGDPGKGALGANGSKASCSGGQGGQGGNGGPGGGGLGGPSLGIAFTGKAPVQQGKTMIFSGTKGNGGLGGSGNVAMNAGADGISAPSQQYK